MINSSKNRTENNTLRTKIIMNKTIIYSISEYLTKAVNSSYKKAKKDVVKNIKKYIVTGKTFDDKLPSYLSIDYSATDKKFLANFEKECFTVACVGTYDLEEKMKEVAKGILELPETDTRDRFKLFVKESQDLLNQYVPDGDKIPPAGWLKTNLQTAVNSSYNASQWQKLQDPAVKDLYPAYKYKTREDSHVRNEHAVLNNSVYLADDPIWKAIYPPNGWNCRCYINYLSTDDIKEPGNSVIYPSDQERKETVKKGKISSDFARNSGIDGHIAKKWLSSKLKEMPSEFIAETKKLVAEYVASADASNAGYTPLDFNKDIKLFDEDTYVKDHKERFESDDYENPRIRMQGERLGLTLDETRIIANYTEFGYEYLNPKLVTGNLSEHYKANVRLLNYALSKLPDYKGNVYRFFNSSLEQFENYKAGDTYQEPRFMSSSTEVGAFVENNIGFFLKSKKGKLIQNISHHLSEKEVLFSNDSKFKITKKYYRANPIDPDTQQLILEMEEI